jgi:hypothetical protein
MRSPFTPHLWFNVQAPAFAGHGHSDWFTFTAPGRGPRPFKEKSQLPATFIRDDIHPQAKIVELVFHGGTLRLFTRFSRKLTDACFIPCRFEATVWSAAASVCPWFRLTRST